MKTITSILITLMFTLPAAAEPITGSVSHIRDADTFLIGKQPIRLCGIDAPEIGTAEGKKAARFLAQIVRGNARRCIPVNEGTVCDGRSKRYNRDRIVAQCFMQGRDLAEILVREGHACDWPKFSGGAYKIVGGCTR